MLRAPSVPPTAGRAPLRLRRGARSTTAPSVPLGCDLSRRHRRRRWCRPTSLEECSPPARRLSDRVSYPVCAGRHCATALRPTPRMPGRLPRQQGPPEGGPHRNGGPHREGASASLHLHGWRVAPFARADRRTKKHLLAVRQRDLARVRPWTAIACPPPGHRDAIACLHRDVALPAVSVQRTDAVALELPVD